MRITNMINNITIIFCLFLATIILPQPISAEPIDVLTFYYPPYMNGDGTGIAEQITTKAFQKKGHVVKFKVFPRKRAITLFKQGEKDFFLGLPVYFSEQEIGYSKIINLRSVLAFKKKRYPNLQIKGLNDLKGKTIGASLGASPIPVFKEAGLIVIEAPKGENTIKMLHSGRIDFLYILDVAAIKLIKKIFPKQQHTFGFLEYKQIGGGLVVRKNSSSWPFFEDFKNGLNSIVNNKEYLHILEQHYGSNQVPVSVIQFISNTTEN